MGFPSFGGFCAVIALIGAFRLAVKVLIFCLYGFGSGVLGETWLGWLILMDNCVLNCFFWKFWTALMGAWLHRQNLFLGV